MARALLVLLCSFGLFVHCNPATVRLAGERRAVVRGEGEPHDDATIDTSFGAFDPLLGAMLPWEEGEREAFYQRVPGVAARADYLVQFFAPIDEASRAVVQASGALVVGFFPHNALVVAASESQVQRLELEAKVRAVVPMPPLLRVHPSLFALLPGSHGRSDDGPAHLNVQGQADVLVEVDEPGHLALIDEALAHSGSEILHAAVEASCPNDVRSIHVRLDATGLGRLGRMAEVVAIAPYPVWKLLNDRSAGLVQSARAGHRSLQAKGLDGTGQIVAVADSGLNTRSCYFKAPNKVVAYQDFAGNSKVKSDSTGHGTHVAGSIAAEDKKGPHSGVAPKAQLVVQNCAVGADMVGLGGNPGPLFRAALAAGAYVHTNSWGIADNSYSPVVRAVDRFAYDNPNMVILAAAGNTGEQGPSSVHAPAGAKNVLAVGAYIGERPDKVAWFSSEGPTDDGRIKPTLLAPGVLVHSAHHNKSCKTQVMSGTSMATPMVAGAVALVRQYFLEGRYPAGVANPAASRVPSAALVKAVLLAGAEPILSGPKPLPDRWQQGFGRVRLDRALALDDAGRRLFVSDNEAALDTGERWQACFDVAADAALDVALSWSDPPPKREGVAVALTHNLDLELLDASGARWLGNAAIDPTGGPSQGPQGAQVEAGADDRNVEEVIRARGLPAGKTCIFVVAKHTPECRQGFALAVLGAPMGGLACQVVRP